MVLLARKSILQKKGELGRGGLFQVRRSKLLMMKNFLVALVIIELCFSCTSRKDVVLTYYNNGKIKSETEMLCGKVHGLRTEYFESGNLKSQGEWKDGKQDGVTKHYYEDGRLESIAFWLEGNQNGESLIYYKNGTLMFSANYVNGCIVGTSKVYFESGDIKERKIYNEAGQIIYISTYHQNRTRDQNFIVPIITGVKDTVAVGEPAIVAVKFPMPMPGKIFIKTFEVDPNGDVTEYKDSYECTSRDTMIYKNSFLIPGIYTLKIQFKQTGLPKNDTLNVNDVEVSHKILVKGRKDKT
jgi:hypothetical protein